MEGLRDFHDPEGIDFYDWCDGFFRDRKPIRSAWKGILHNVIEYPSPNPFNCRILSLEELVLSEFFLESMANCRGLWTLSEHTANYLAGKLGRRVGNLVHPAHPTASKYSHASFMASPKVVMIGQWMRRHESMNELDVGIPKKVVACGEESLYKRLDKTVEILPFLGPSQYDAILSSSLIFLDFYDVAACNTVLECLMANTPLIVRKLPAIVEYLGEGYPLYYEGMEEASKKASDIRKILLAHVYLRRMDKTKFCRERFSSTLCGAQK